MNHQQSDIRHRAPWLDVRRMCAHAAVLRCAIIELHSFASPEGEEVCRYARPSRLNVCISIAANDWRGTRALSCATLDPDT